MKRHGYNILITKLAKKHCPSEFGLEDSLRENIAETKECVYGDGAHQDKCEYCWLKSLDREYQEELMACSPDCDAIDPVTNERDESKCAGCDAKSENMKSPEEVNIKKIMENIAAIGMMAGVMIAEGQLCPGDSTTLHGGIVRMGFEFEKTYSDEDIDHDYIGVIDEFARKKLLEYYGIEE